MARRKNTDKRHGVSCPNCGRDSSVRVNGNGFNTIACRQCLHLIHDMDKYFGIVYGGREIVPMQEKKDNTKVIIIGIIAVATIATIYMLWVTYAMVLLLSIPVAAENATRFTMLLLIMLGLPYILGKKLLTYI